MTAEATRIVPNADPATGIRYGVVSGSQADSLIEEIIVRGEDLNYLAYKKEIAAEIVAALEEIGPFEGDEDDDHYTYERLEPLAKVIDQRTSCSDKGLRAAKNIIEAMEEGDEIPEIAKEAVDQLDELRYESDGATYKYEDKAGNQFFLSTSSGNVVTIIKSDKIVFAERLCSPCYPNAADLDSGYAKDESGGFKAYGIPEQYKTGD